MFEVRHGHDWEYFPVMTSNPEIYTRRCKICGLKQKRYGVTVVPAGPSIPGTSWEDAKDGT